LVGGCFFSGVSGSEKSGIHKSLGTTIRHEKEMGTQRFSKKGIVVGVNKLIGKSRNAKEMSLYAVRVESGKVRSVGAIYFGVRNNRDTRILWQVGWALSISHHNVYLVDPG